MYNKWGVSADGTYGSPSGRKQLEGYQTQGATERGRGCGPSRDCPRTIQSVQAYAMSPLRLSTGSTATDGCNEDPLSPERRRDASLSRRDQKIGGVEGTIPMILKRLAFLIGVALAVGSPWPPRSGKAKLVEEGHTRRRTFQASPKSFNLLENICHSLACFL